MGIHSTIRLQLYDYLQGELDEHDRLEVENHVRLCNECRTSLEDLRATLVVFPRPVGDPSEEMTPEFWQDLMDDVEHGIAQEERQAPSFWGRTIEQFIELPIFRPRVALAMAAMLVVIIAGVVTRELIIRRTTLPVQKAQIQASRADSISTSDPTARMSGYLRRSKTLLVGLTNMKPAPTGSVDLSTERKMSRELVKEARFLKQLPLDDRSVRLLSDLEKIQIELANLDASYNAPEVELIRHGIRRENLLFKVRVSETLYERASFVQSNYTK